MPKKSQEQCTNAALTKCLDFSRVEQHIAATHDIHVKTAEAMFGVPSNQVTSDMRRAARSANFAEMYGVSLQLMTNSREGL